MSQTKKPHTYIIAEIGVNHNGCVDTAKKLIKDCASSGVDAVKFQIFHTDHLTTQQASLTKYQTENTRDISTQFEMLKNLELTLDEHRRLKEYTENCGLTYMASAFDLLSLESLKKLNIPILKVPSGEINNLPYLSMIGTFNKKTILSTGMSTLEEVQSAINVLTRSGTKRNNISILHTTSQYPTPFADVNLACLSHLKQELDLDIGYSDHTIGIEVAIAAVALGARIIEKHVTLDRTMVGPDHSASIEIIQLTQMVKSIRNIEASMGSPVKCVTQSELENRQLVRKSIVAKKNIKKGETLSRHNMTCKRPGNGTSPMNWETVIGTTAQRDYKPDELI